MCYVYNFKGDDKKMGKTRNRNCCGKHRIPKITFQHSQTMTKVLLMMSDRNYF